MQNPVTLAPYAGVWVKTVPAGTIVSDPFGAMPDIVVDDNTAAFVRGTMFVTDVIAQRIRDEVPGAHS